MNVEESKSEHGSEFAGGACMPLAALLTATSRLAAASERRLARRVNPSSGRSSTTWARALASSSHIGEALVEDVLPVIRRGHQHPAAQWANAAAVPGAPTLGLPRKWY